MAEGKKSFVLYSDYIDLFSQLPDEKAGQLIKHIFEYVNDKNPKTKDLLLNIAFEPIKKQLKRDLVHWENIRFIRSESGKLGGRPKQTKAKKAKGLLEKQSKAKKAVTVTVNDTVNDTNIPSKLIFINYAISKIANIDQQAVGLKYDAWVINNWHNGKDKKITNWKSSLNNTLPYLPTKEMSTKEQLIAAKLIRDENK